MRACSRATPATLQPCHSAALRPCSPATPCNPATPCSPSIHPLSASNNLKYSANLWLHNYDFRGPNTHGCEMHGNAKRTSNAAAALNLELLEPTFEDYLPPIRQDTSVDGRAADEEEEEPPKIEL